MCTLIWHFIGTGHTVAPQCIYYIVIIKVILFLFYHVLCDCVVLIYTTCCWHGNKLPGNTLNEIELINAL